MPVHISIRNKTARCALFSFLVPVLIFSCSGFGFSQDQVNDGRSNKKAISYYHYDIEEVIRERKDITKFKDALPPLDTVPIVFKTKTGELLIEGMKKDKKITNKKSKQSSGREYDLHTYSGRSAWVFANLFKVDLRNETRDDKNPPIHKRAQKLLEAYREGIIDASRRQYDSDLPNKKLIQSYQKIGKSNRQVQIYTSALHDVRNNYEFGISNKELIKKYRGKIQFGITDYKTANSSEDLFRKLISEWMPIGKKLETLSEITGHKPKKMELQGYNADYYYSFDDGRLSKSFGFNVKEGIITSVSLF